VSACPHGIAARWACQQCSEIDDAPAQLREKVEALNLVLREAYRAIDALNTRLKMVERVNAALLDRVNQLVEFHGIRPITPEPNP
jgi:hypothetical protein